MQTAGTARFRRRTAGLSVPAYEQFDAPTEEEVVDVEPQMKVMGKALKQAAKAVVEYLAALSEEDALTLKVRTFLHHGARDAGTCVRCSRTGAPCAVAISLQHGSRAGAMAGDGTPHGALTAYVWGR